MVFALADVLDSNWDTVCWVVGAFFAVGILLHTVLAIRKRSLRIGIWGAVGTLLACSFLLVAWHYFGWETLHTDTGWTIRRNRTLGRVTVLAYDTNRDWFADAKYIYRFSDPWIPAEEYRHYYIVGKEDRNYDGRWDTWWIPTDDTENGKRVILVRADTNLDGRPDYDFRKLAGVTSEEYAEVEQLRGF
jgi:hypothetical protein